MMHSFFRIRLPLPARWLMQSRWLSFCVTACVAVAGAGTPSETAWAKGTWRSGRTAVSELHVSEKTLLLGAPLSDVQTNGAYGRSTRVWEDALPERFDWRAVDGVDFVSPVKDQGRCGSCVAFAASSTFETQMNITTRSRAFGWNFSAQHLFSCGGGSCAMGWFPANAADFLKGKGLPENACFVYQSGALGQDIACKKTCTDAPARSSKALVRVRSKALSGASVDEVKQALLNGPLLTTMKVYNDFYSYTGGVYRRQTGALLGGHAVMIVGWNNEDRAWIARNSWGTDWGEAGDFRVAWDDRSGVGGYFIGFQAAQPVSTLLLEGVIDHHLVHAPTELTVRGQNLSFVSSQLQIRGPSGAGLVSVPFSSDGSLVFRPQDFQDGIYTLQARAQLPDGSERISQARLVYIRNGAATATIKIERMTPNMNVWDKIIPQFAVTSMPVPLNKIRYKLVNDKGVIVRVRSTDHTADRVAMSLNPEGLEAGRYVLVAEALSDETTVVASDTLTFNITRR